MTENPQNLFNDIAAFIAESRQLLREGGIVQLTGLDSHIDTLCKQVMQLSEEERLLYADRLESLFNDLTALGEEIDGQKQAIADEIRHLSSHKKANTAYRTGDSRDNFGHKEDKSRFMETVDPLRFVVAFAFVLGLIAMMAVTMKRYGKNSKMFFSVREGARLEVVEVRYIDSRRKLALVRRDGVEHLLLLADGRELVVESGIPALPPGAVSVSE